ncbi:type 2 lactosamine alpha-2,3-sialyltransferase isoform X1 [Equus przewalskii]|uniref:Type 2 lactosamine alpha-2,3-sialyltransferase isoform X1 n=3 Tax=Equus TaxID=9789 RepID=A0ABM2FC54_EQUPR|nr:PREDICTED: type 2 lactosamine alpha-2,3-sialyltransferase isoform X5 [Equus przewalskii]XP_008535031.1 PREDICTED: type 2 lactosamine alpha-2,3-sialyltransferase isoform X5 [Equus przewalskii]
MKKPSDQTAAQQLGLLVMRNYAEQMRRPSSFFSKALAKEKPAPPSVLDNFWGRGPSDLAEGLLSLPHHLLHLQEERAFGEQIPKLAGATAMRGYLVAIFLSAIFLYYVLHCISWGTSVYWAHPVEMQPRKRSQPCREKPAFASLLRFHEFHPFLCASDFKKIASLYGGDKFSLPYGIKASEEPFRLALSALQSCDLFDEFDTVPCKKCVVVGNGGVLKNKTLGEKIDSYDVIIRMNNGPVLGHEEDVGRRTTFRLFYPESVFTDSNHRDPNTTAILTAFKPLDLKWLYDLLMGSKIDTKGFWQKPALDLIYKPYQIRILDPFITRTAAYELLHFPKVFPKNQKRKHPTTGIIAITLAFHICHEVHLAGFKYNFSDLKSPLHYYGNSTMSLMNALSQFDCRAALFEGHYRKKLCNQPHSRLTLQTQKMMLTVLVLFLYCNF